MDVSLLRDDQALSSLRRSIGVSLTVVPLSHTRWDGIKADCRFLATAAGKMLRRRTTDALNEVVNRIRAVQRGGARTHLMSEYLAVLRDRHQRLLRLSSRTVVEQRLQDRPVDDPEVLRCLRAVRTGGGGPPFIHNVQLADGSFSDDPHDIDTVFRDFFSQLFCSDHLASENFAEKVRQFCGDVPACPEFLASSLVRPTDRDELFEILRAMKTGSAPGPDGLRAEFYVSFWEIFGAPLVQLVNGILETGAVPPSFKRGRVVLVPKEGGLPSDPSAWRPITLLNTDYKLLTSLLVSRLRHILPHVALNVSTRGKVSSMDSALSAMCTDAETKKRNLYVSIWVYTRKLKEDCSFKPIYYHRMQSCWLKMQQPKDEGPQLWRG
ncbi:hypothetical protein ISCGN_018963 [Ixodes scapularis]